MPGAPPQVPTGQLWGANTIFWNYGSPDPSGPYPKPDINVCAPANHPITALMPGTVTSVQNTHFGDEIGLQPAVTVKNDNPTNSYAQYSAYTHLGSANVHAGDHINPGDTIGFALGQGVCTAFALTNMSPYGSGDFTGNPLLDATQIVKNAIAGNYQQGGGGTQSGGGGSNVPLVGPLIDWFNQQVQAFQNQFKPLLQWLSNPVRVIKMGVGISLISLAIVLLIVPHAEEITSKVEKVAPFLAV